LNEKLVDLYIDAKLFIKKSKYADELAYVNQRTVDSVTQSDFFREYVYVVLNTGMKNQVAQKMYERFCNSDDPISTVKHKGKRKAIAEFADHQDEFFRNFKEATNKLMFLETLPFIGSITKYHLARNLGVDCAKPDRHMTRLAKTFGFTDVQAMCEEIKKATGDRIGTIDVILWRACNLGHIKHLEGGQTVE
jgi:hypothetical protein